MRVLVTGGSGFIGSHVAKRLVEHGHDVCVIDKSKPYGESVEWFKGDILNEKEVLEACKDIELIYHLAAIADVNVALSHFEMCLMVNEIGTANLLRAATAREVERIILASTTWVYGKTTGTVDESSPIPFPDHIYTKTKIGQEQLVHTWHEHYGLPYTILRYDIPYGPGMRSNMAISIFTRKAMRQEPITVFGSGDQGRCFLYAEDLAEGNVAALKDNAKNEIFNLAGSKFVTMNQIVEALRDIFGDLQVKYGPSRPHDFKGVVISIKKAREYLGWEPKTSFREGLEKYIEYLSKES